MQMCALGADGQVVELEDKEKRENSKCKRGERFDFCDRVQAKTRRVHVLALFYFDSL